MSPVGPARTGPSSPGSELLLGPKVAGESTYPHTPQPLSTPLPIYEKERPERWSDDSIGPEGPETGMDVTVPKKELLRLVGRCQGVADKKSTMPALSNVLVSVSGPSELRVAATDLYLSVSGVTQVEVRKGGSIAVPAKELHERLKMMPDGPVQISTTEGFATVIKSATTARRYTLRGMPGEEFPQLAEPDPNATSLELGVGVL